MDSDDLIDPNIFEVSWPIWFIGPVKDLPTEMGSLAKSLTTVHTSNGFHPVAFTDSDLAYGFIESLQCKGKLKPIAISTIEQFLEFLECLTFVGYSRLAFDPRPNHVRAIPISRVADAIRNSPDRPTDKN